MGFCVQALESLRRGCNPPYEVNADPACDSDEIRDYLRKRGIKSNIPVNKRNRKSPKRGRPTRLDKDGYMRNRSAVERFNACLDRVIQEDTGEVRALSNLLHGGCQFGMYQDGAEGFEMSSSVSRC